MRAAIALSLLILVSPPPTPAAVDTAGAGVRGTLLIIEAPAGTGVVYLLPADGRAVPPSPIEQTIIQQDLRFWPQFTVVTVGSTIRFENRDDEIHNVHSKSPQHRFDLGAHMPGTVRRVEMERAGTVNLRCNIHHEMRGRIFVSPSPYFSITDNQGQFSIANVPPGSYRLELWHAQLTPGEMVQGARFVDIDGTTQEVTIDLTAGAEGTDLTDITRQDWIAVVEEIQASLQRAIALWIKGSRTGATSRVMVAHSRLYGESGLREAISQRFGRARAVQHERQFDQIRRAVQGVGEKKMTEAHVRDEVQSLTERLKNDALKLSGI